jgi:4-amino-4-deoxy-L-arabinose transferase-like glycosyltransferase
MPQDAMHERQSVGPSRSLAAALIAFALLQLLLAGWGLRRFPNSGDEYSYLLQAKLFAAGRLSAASAPESLRAAFTLDHVLDDGRVRSKYPPGWPLLLAFGESAGVAWAVNPLLGVATLALLFGIAREVGSRAAAWAALLVTGATPLFALNAASYFSHPAVLLTTSAALLALLRSLRAPAPGWSWLAGAALGFGLCVRPLDGALAGAAALACAPLLGMRRLARVALGAAPFVALYGLYDELQFGSAFGSGYALYAPIREQLYPGLGDSFDLANARHWREHADWLVEFWLWTLPAALVAIPLAWSSPPGDTAARCARRFALALCALLLAAIQFVGPEPGDQYGPRYLHLLLLPFALFTGLGAAALLRALERVPRAPLAAALVLALAVAPARTLLETLRARQVIERRSTVYRLAEGAGLRDAVVMLGYSDEYPSHWYTRNGIDLAAPILYVRDVGLEAQLRAHLPGRSFYRYAWDAQRRARVLLRVPPPPG